MILDEIFARSKEELDIKKKRVSQNALEKKAERILASKNPPQPEKVLQALRKNADKFNIIAEVKKASPSKGIIRSKFFSHTHSAKLRAWRCGGDFGAD